MHYPYPEYGIVAWGGAAQSLIQNIQIAQNTLPKIIYHKPRLTPINRIYTKSNGLTVKRLYYKKKCILHKKKNIN